MLLIECRPLSAISSNACVGRTHCVWPLSNASLSVIVKPICFDGYQQRTLKKHDKKTVLLTLKEVKG